MKNTQPAIGAKMSAKALEYLKNNEEVTRVTGVECAGRNGRGREKSDEWTTLPILDK